MINGVACKRIEELEQKISPLEDALSSYENLLKHLKKKNPKLFRELGLE